MTDTTDGLNGLNYERLVENALRLVVREALRIAQNDGLSGETHFFIAFDTRMPGVIMEDTLRDKHPDASPSSFSINMPIRRSRMSSSASPCSLAANRRP